MSLTFRPESHAERQTVVRALTEYLAQPSAEDAVRTWDGLGFADARARYTAAVGTYAERLGAWRVASAAAEGADAAFDQEVRLLVASTLDTHGRPQPRVLAGMLGGTLPGDLVHLGYAEELRRSAGLLAELPTRTDLQVDPARVEALGARRSALEAAATALDAAYRARVEAGRALEDAVDTFDRSYGKLVRALVLTLGQDRAAAVLPRFPRAAGSEPTPAATPGASVAPGEPAGG